MAVGAMINLSLGEAMLCLRVYEDYARYHAESPFYSKLSGATRSRMDELMDHLARWVVLVKQEGAPDGAAATNRETWEQLAFPTTESRVGRHSL